ncbi:lycopene cyclase family protein [Flammeovirgaceae bacterium SG7u.111]|nr:lycopene cyclase family protein [Flammeovirgaceae bacterium SG7u.132]WPO38640.1 lycopene cyclase family protein [Flammeovirgaceae bacterium SG7u.111]
MDKNKFDIIIAGAGLAGLSLAYRLSLEPYFSDKKILLIDKDNKTQNDRTWCFWGEPPKHFESIISHSWSQISFISDSYSNSFDLSPAAYYQVRGADFYRFIKEEIAKHKNIQWLKAEINKVEEVGERVIVSTTSGNYQTDLLFDSRFDEDWVKEQTKNYLLLLQHFRGWVIKTDEPVFEVANARMFDFRIPQNNEVRFVYVLPYSETEALVEFTIFSKSLLKNEEYDQALKSYVAEYLGLESYEVVEEENGVIPMSDYPFAKAESKRWINIGTRAGMCKPSSGYAFKRVQADTEELVALLLAGKDLQKHRKSYGRFLLYDAMMLDIMARSGGNIKGIFTDLFSSNPIHKVLGFLDEQTSFGEEVKIMSSVPHLPFFVSALRLAKRKVF